MDETNLLQSIHVGMLAKFKSIVVGVVTGVAGHVLKNKASRYCTFFLLVALRAGGGGGGGDGTMKDLSFVPFVCIFFTPLWDLKKKNITIYLKL